MYLGYPTSIVNISNCPRTSHLPILYIIILDIKNHLRQILYWSNVWVLLPTAGLTRMPPEREMVCSLGAIGWTRPMVAGLCFTRPHSHLHSSPRHFYRPSSQALACHCDYNQQVTLNNNRVNCVSVNDWLSAYPKETSHHFGDNYRQHGLMSDDITFLNVHV